MKDKSTWVDLEVSIIFLKITLATLKTTILSWTTVTPTVKNNIANRYVLQYP